MKTDAVRWHLLNGGLLGARFNTSPSYCHGDGSLADESVVEQFSITAPDGSRFLISITKLKEGI